MTRVTVSGQYDLPPLPEAAHIVVALADDEYRTELHPALRRREHLQLAMSDTAWPAELDDSVTVAVTYPTAEHLDTLRDWVQAARPARVHVCCHAGISRSPALALAVLRLTRPELDDALAVAALLKVRPHCLPSPRLLALIDEHFGFALAAAWDAQEPDRRQGSAGERW